MLEQQGIHVYVIEHDIYARLAIISYLSWDRRTRVIGHGGTLGEMIEDLAEEDQLRIDAVVLDSELAKSAQDLKNLIQEIVDYEPECRVICLSHHADLEQMRAAQQAGACAFLVREMVGIGISSAVRFALGHEFSITGDLIEVLGGSIPAGISCILPDRRHYPRLTERIEQALWLCVVEGLPAQLAAEEMGVSTSTVRSYIKEGYRILEASDDTIYPISMSPAERAFLRYTALDMPDDPLTPSPWRTAA